MYRSELALLQIRITEKEELVDQLVALRDKLDALDNMGPRANLVQRTFYRMGRALSVGLRKLRKGGARFTELEAARTRLAHLERREARLREGLQRHVDLRRVLELPR